MLMILCKFSIKMPKFYKAKFTHKYYVIYNGRKINFGDQWYGHYKDQTDIKAFSNRRRQYYQ